jgi:hypothetical protein
MTNSTTPRNLDTFTRENDPLYEDKSPVAIFPWRLGKRVKTLLVVAAQNSTPVHAEWWAVLQRIAEHRGADLVVLPMRYKNPTSRWVGSQEGKDFWAKETRPFLANVRQPLNDNLTLLGDIKIQPTAADPLTGFEAVSGAASAIVAHPKIQTRTIATPQNRMAKILMTSGSCTVENYSDTRAGRVGQFHHSLSCVLVEVVNKKRFHMRRIHFDGRSKSAIDSARGEQYFADSVQQAPRALGLITGDWHDPFTDKGVIRATYGQGGMVGVLRPRNILLHDSTDGYPVNPHHKHNPFNRVAKRFGGLDSVRASLESLRRFIEAHTIKDTQNVIVTSNHDDFLTRYIVDADWREDPTNAEWYLETALHMVRNTKLTNKGTEYPNAFTYWMRRYNMPQTRILDEDESFMLGTHELGMHGNRGPNGARGSIRNLRRIGVKTITGHPHSPGEDEGCTQVGTSTGLRLEYNAGPSSWHQAHCALDANDKRQLLFIIDGEYRAPL